MAHSFYGSDLAQIHVDGYGFHWEGASPTVLKWLADAGIRTGTVVDLGCGGGQWLARLAEKGYTPVGVDVSPAMFRSARKLVPSAKLICGSFAEVDLPSCDAVTSLGEPLNYLQDTRSVRQTLRRCTAHCALAACLFSTSACQPPSRSTRVSRRASATTGPASHLSTSSRRRNGSSGGLSRSAVTAATTDAAKKSTSFASIRNSKSSIGSTCLASGSARFAATVRIASAHDRSCLWPADRAR